MRREVVMVRALNFETVKDGVVINVSLGAGRGVVRVRITSESRVLAPGQGVTSGEEVNAIMTEAERLYGEHKGQIDAAVRGFENKQRVRSRS